MQCNLCNQSAKRNHCNHETGKNEYLCEYHYSLWHPGRTLKLPTKKCYVCKDIAFLVEHHVSYFPQKIIKVCAHCHNKIHKTKELSELLPEKYFTEIFYAKGNAIMKNTWPFVIRQLSDEEILLKKIMHRTKAVLINASL